MMSAPAEGTKRLAELFREMLALSKKGRSNHSQSAAADDSIKLCEAQDASGTPTCAPQGKEASDEAEDQGPRH